MDEDHAKTEEEKEFDWKEITDTTENLLILYGAFALVRDLVCLMCWRRMD